MHLVRYQRRRSAAFSFPAAALAVSMVTMLVGSLAAPAALAREAQAAAQRPQVQIVSPSPDDRRVVLTGQSVDVAFTANRERSYALDVRPSTGGDWASLNNGSGAADQGQNLVSVGVPRGLERGDYDLRVRLYTRKPDRPLATDVAEAVLRIESRPGYVSTISSGPLAGTSFDYRESPNTPQVAEWGPIRGRVTYVGPACDDSPGVPDATDGHRIALVERGGCPFVEKMGNVKPAGWSVFLMFNQRTGDDGCDGFPSSMSTASSIPMIAIPRSAGLQLLGEAGAGGIDCSDPPAVRADIGQVGEGVLLYAEFDPDSTRTGFEQRNGTDWTSHREEQRFLETVAETSDRMAYRQVGTSVQNRPLHLVAVGHPEPPADEEITDGRSVLVIGSQHGNEPAGREMALQLLRDLALTDDDTTVDQLSDTTVLFIPSANPDARVANTRGNADGVDTNRDHLHLETPEATAIADVVQEFTPDITIDAHERPSGANPDLEVLWPRNLNVDEPLRGLNVEMIQDHVRPAVEDAGFSTGLYGTPGGSGGEDERIARNVFGLRHGVGMLTETGGQDPPVYRVDAQLEAVRAVLRFHRERTEELATVVTEAPERKRQAGADQSEPFYLGGADNWPPEDNEVLDPPPCGYVINTTQADRIDRHAELFGIQTEQVSDEGVFVTMGQPMMTVVPLLLDRRADFNLVNGIALTDAAVCADPGSVEPPGPTEPAQYATAFSDDAAGQPPSGWSSAWRDSDWTVLDGPRRLQHQVDLDGGRRALVWDEIGDQGYVQGDVEVFGLVRASNLDNTAFQIGFDFSGGSGTENAHYIDARTPFASSNANQLRISRYQNGSYTRLDSTEMPFTFREDTWYRVVLQRDDSTLRAKIWPNGEDEPSDWLVTATDDSFDAGQVGLGHFNEEIVNDWAYIGVGTGGEPAPRAPADQVPLPDPPDPVSGVSVDQEYGFASVSWNAVDRATEYEIERTPLDGGEPAGPAQLVGRWMPDRHPELTFADSGFEFGATYRWRVRAVGSGETGAWSAPVTGTTQQMLGPQAYLTEFEQGGGADWTSHAGEVELLGSIADSSDRVRLQEIGQTAEGRPLHLVTIGDPAPGTPEEIAEAPSVLLVCTVHGTEPAAREACLTLLRQLAFSDEPWVTELLSESTVLMIPTANPDGRAAGTRENSAGQDLNRDHLLLRHPETVTISEVLRDYQPDLVIDGHEYQAADASDLSAMWARSPNVGEQLWSLSQDDMVRGRLFGAAGGAGWWPSQYPLTANAWETQLQNTAGLKNHIGVVVETRRRPGPTRPAEGDPNTLVTTPENQKRRAYAQLWAFRELLDFHRQNLPAIAEAIAAAEAGGTANQGPVYLDGRRDVPVTPPTNEAPTRILDPPPCGYQLTPEQYDQQAGDVASVGDRLAFHGVDVEPAADGFHVPLTQPRRGLIPYLLDPESELGLVAATRLDECTSEEQP